MNDDFGKIPDEETWGAIRAALDGNDSATPADQVCATCNGHGMIGGPSFYAPDEGGEPCPDCATPADHSRLQVWSGSMPESNGKTNFTAILHRGDITQGFTIERSEYPDRVRYEADRVRWLIGEIDKEPWILDYDADKHSGYIAPADHIVDAHKKVDADSVPAAWAYKVGSRTYFNETRLDHFYSLDNGETYIKGIPLYYSPTLKENS